MDAFIHQLAERGIDRTLALDPAHAGEGWALDRQAEMALAGRVVANVAAMLLAVVNQMDSRGGQCGAKPALDFGRDRASGG